MDETCPVCGRDVWPDGALQHYGYDRCWHRGGHECQGFAVGYQRGLAAASPKWQPMETAPRDGTRVLVLHPPAFSNEDSRGAVDVATYDDQRHALRAKPFWRWERAYATREEMRRCAPTAWMPLPNWTDVDAAAAKAKGRDDE